MDAQRAPEHEREASPPSARSLLHASWFRAIVVFVILGAVALVAVPWSLRVAARAAADRAPVDRSSRAPTAHADLPLRDIAGSPLSDSADAPPRDTQVSSAGAGRVLPVRASFAADVPAALAGATNPTAAGAGAKAGPLLAQAPAPRPGEAKAAPAVETKSAAEGGGYWVQVGAFRDPQAARRVAEKLRETNFRVQESTVTRPTPASPGPTSTPPGGPVGAAAPASGERPAAAPDRYEVIVIGTRGEIEPKLAAKGLATRPEADGVAVTPALALNEAVDLSKQLGADGLTVRVRRAGAAAPPGTLGKAGAAGAPSAPPASAGGGETLYRVRVGEFPDRAAAMAALQQLEARGFKPFLARGGQ